MKVHDVLGLILKAAFDKSLLISAPHMQTKLIIIKLDFVVKIDEFLQSQFLLLVLLQKSSMS